MLFSVGVLSKCVEPWLSYEGSCYYISSNLRRNFADARADCVKLGGVLTSIPSREVNTFLVEKYNNCTPFTMYYTHSNHVY